MHDPSGQREPSGQRDPFVRMSNDRKAALRRGGWVEVVGGEEAMRQRRGFWGKKNPKRPFAILGNLAIIQQTSASPCSSVGRAADS